MSTPAETAQRLGGQLGHAVRGAHIRGDDVVGNGAFGARPRRDDHPGATGPQPVGDALADAMGAAGNQGRPAGELIKIGHTAIWHPPPTPEGHLLVGDVLRMQHLGIAQLLGNPEPVDQ